MGSAWLPESVDNRTRLLSLPFGRVFVVDVGPQGAVSGPPIVLVHGLFTTHHLFHRVIPALAQTRRVVAVDLPGCGDSDHPGAELTDHYSVPWLAHAVLQTLGALDIGAAHWVGHDLGGAVALSAAGKEPRRVGALTLVAPVAVSVSLPLPGTLSVVPSLGLEVFRRTLRRTDLKNLMALGLSTPELLDEGEVNVYWDRIGRRGGREALYSMLEGLGSLVRLREQFSSVQTPTVLVWGDRDALVPSEQGERLAELLPEASLELLEGCGHNPAHEQPERLVELLQRDLQKP